MTTKPRRKVLSPEVRQIKERRLEELEIQAATYGALNVPPHITTEIEDLQSELELADIIARPIDDRLVQQVKQTDYGELLSKFIGDHARRLSSIELWQKSRDDSLKDDDEKRETRQRELDGILAKISVNVRTVAIVAGFNTILVVIVLIALLLR